MTYIYYIDDKTFTSDILDVIPFYKISSPDENTPALEDLKTGYKYWCLKGWKIHRLTGPARICPNGSYDFFLNDKKYTNIHDWLKDHPNQTNAFQVEMLLKYT
jgi:hypothetical protein